MMKWYFLLPWNLINAVAVNQGVDAFLVASIIQKETEGDQYACRYEDHYKWLYKPEFFAKKNRISLATETMMQKTSFGLMQVMGAVAREDGYDRELVELAVRPELALEISVKHLKNFIRKYGNIEDAVAAYNAGSVRKNIDGSYVNRDYVDQVMSYYRELGGV